jgi:hypothetical protein
MTKNIVGDKKQRAEGKGYVEKEKGDWRPEKGNSPQIL